jgi:hypothetical protein
LAKLQSDYVDDDTASFTILFLVVKSISMMIAALHLTYAALYLLIVGGSWKVYRMQQYAHSHWLLIVALGLVYDNLIIGLGAQIGVHPLLELLSMPRFILHALFTPFLMLTGFSIANAKRLVWARKQGIVEGRLYGLTLLLVIIGIVQTAAEGSLVPACADGIVRYTQNLKETELCSDHIYSDTNLAHTPGPPIAPIVTILVLLAIGVVLAWKAQTGWVLVGSMAMLLVGGAPSWMNNGAELILLGTLLISFLRPHPEKIE